MTYKEMLDKLEYLESKVAHLELENRYAKERLNKLEYAGLSNPPKFTSGTLPQIGTLFYDINPQDGFK